MYGLPHGKTKHLGADGTIPRAGRAAGCARSLQAKGSFENTDVVDLEKLVLLRHAPRAGIAPGGGVVLAVDGCVYGTAVPPPAQTPRHVAAGHLVTARNGNPAEVNRAAARR